MTLVLIMSGTSARRPALESENCSASRSIHDSVQKSVSTWTRTGDPDRPHLIEVFSRKFKVYRAINMPVYPDRRSSGW